MPFVKGDKLYIKIIKCTDLPANDLFGKSDPYVVFQAIHIEAYTSLKTTVIKSNLNPEWNEEFIFNYKHDYPSTETSFSAIIYDWNRFTKHDELGHAFMKINPDNYPPGEEVTETLNLMGVVNAKGSLTISFRIEKSEESLKFEEERKKLILDMKIVNDLGFPLYIPNNFNVASSYQSLVTETKLKLPVKVAYYSPSLNTAESIIITCIDINGTSTKYTEAVEKYVKCLVEEYQHLALKRNGSFVMVEENTRLPSGGFAFGKYSFVFRIKWRFEENNKGLQNVTNYVVKPNYSSKSIIAIMHCTDVKVDESVWGNDVIEKICKASCMDNL
ncbi:hypothetical protein ABK040_000802 [Willaertia magna]